MSRSAGVLAIRDQLLSPWDDPTSPGLGPSALNPLDKSGWLLERSECEVAPFLGKPPPKCGERFVGVYCGGRTTKEVSYGLYEEYNFYVATTFRIPRIPFDRLGPDLIAKLMAYEGYDNFLDAIRLLIHKDYAVGLIRARANAIIEARVPAGSGINGFSTGLQSLGDADPQPVGADWFGADDEPSAGIVIRQKFGKCVREQSWVEPGRVLT